MLRWQSKVTWTALSVGHYGLHAVRSLAELSSLSAGRNPQGLCEADRLETEGWSLTVFRKRVLQNPVPAPGIISQSRLPAGVTTAQGLDPVFWYSIQRQPGESSPTSQSPQLLILAYFLYSNLPVSLKGDTPSEITNCLTVRHLNVPRAKTLGLGKQSHPGPHFCSWGRQMATRGQCQRPPSRILPGVPRSFPACAAPAPLQQSPAARSMFLKFFAD